jgi:hypothetical protein
LYCLDNVALSAIFIPHSEGTLEHRGRQHHSDANPPYELFSKVKQCPRVATRDDKLTANYRSPSGRRGNIE